MCFGEKKIVLEVGLCAHLNGRPWSNVDRLVWMNSAEYDEKCGDRLVEFLLKS